MDLIRRIGQRHMNRDKKRVQWGPPRLPGSPPTNMREIKLRTGIEVILAWLLVGALALLAAVAIGGSVVRWLL